MRQVFDLLIIGGGVNGAGIARDASGRGLSVCLVDAGDIGGATSSASTKLLHGGLRYLEFFEFSLVRKALAERERLLDLMPHISWPQSFVLPVVPAYRASWKIRAGLFLYDHLARHPHVPSSEAVALRADRAGQPLAPAYDRAFRYWDGWVDDSRLVILNARDAAARGAVIRPRTRITRARHGGTLWQAETACGDSIAARRIVNCAGPWAEQVGRDILGLTDAPRLRLVQGAHIVVPRIGSGNDGYMFQQPDRRIVFMLPYEDMFTLIGTTDTPVDTPDNPQVRPEERAYLLAAANRYLARPIVDADIVHAFAGIRPLVLENDKSARETSRDWKIIEHAGDHAISIVGGKITTYRRLAEAVMALISPGTKSWTASSPLPGGDIARLPGEDGQQAFARWRDTLRVRHHDYDRSIVTRLARLFGTEADAMLTAGLGANLGGIFEAELRHMVEKEWARTADDILWRRTKLGLHLSPQTKDAVTDWLRANVS